MGNSSNGVRTAVPYIDVVGNSAYIYVYGFANGLAAYKLTLKPTGLDKNEMSSVSISLNANRIKISEEVALVEVISITGQKLISAQNVSVIDAPKTTGVYIVNIVDKNGAKKFQKISVN